MGRTARHLGIAAALALCAAAVLPAEPAGDSLEFVATQAEAPLIGRIRSFANEIRLDPAHPQDGKVRIRIDLATVDAGSRDADDLLRSPEFFDIDRSPQALYESQAIRALDGGRFEAAGTFTIKGTSRPLTLAFRDRPDGSGGHWFEGGGSVSRLAYNIGNGQWKDTSTLDDAVEIRFRVHLSAH